MDDAVDAAEEIEQLRQLRGPELLDYVMTHPWYAQPDDTIGGWCVTPLPVPPSSGVFTIANFLDSTVAHHISKLHNDALNERSGTAEFGTIEDADGQGWFRCQQDCQLELVRPGKVQCICDQWS